MQSAIRFECSCDQIFHLAFVADIGFHENSFASIAFDGLDCFRSRGIDVADDNLRAALREEQCCRATDATTPARNERDLA